ncbi:MAG: hypothetical protein U0X39_03215 [Bacteroidales bacterium]
MKFIYVTCNVSIVDAVTGLLDSAGFSSFQVTEKVLAKSTRGKPRLDTPVWPGHNIIINIQVTDDTSARELIDRLSSFNKNGVANDDELLTVCSWTLDTYFFE